MADNVQINQMADGDVIGADDISGVKYQRIKLIHGADGTNDGDVASGNPLPVKEADGGNVTLGAKADARSTATDTTAVTAMQVLKEISYMEQNPASRAVTNAGTFAVQATLAAETTKVIGTVNVSAGQSIGVTSGTAANCKVEATIAAAQTLGTVTTVGTVTTLTNWEGVLTDDAAFTPATSKVRAIGLMADETSTDSVDEGDVGVPRMTLDRKQIVSDYPSATGEGLDIFRSIDVDESEEDVKQSAGKLYGWFLHNAHTATLFVKFYNATAANTTVGTTTPIMTIPIPAGASANVHFNKGIAFSTALCIAATTGVADNDTGAPGANLVIANIFYK
jgi:hypothetical protein